MNITVVFDNCVTDNRLTPGWGFSCLVELPQKTVLFDTGGDGSILLDNMSRLQIDPQSIDAVVLSHIHDDHTGGLASFLEKNTSVTVYLLRSFPDSFKDRVRSFGAKIEEVYSAGELFPGVYTTGELDKGIKEQSLVVKSGEGLVVITGCAHPGIVEIVQKAKDVLPGEKVYLVMGGFHLRKSSGDKNRSVVEAFRRLGVAKAAPSHCSGDEIRQLFKEQYGDDYINSGVGKKLTFS